MNAQAQFKIWQGVADKLRHLLNTFELLVESDFDTTEISKEIFATQDLYFTIKLNYLALAMKEMEGSNE